MTFTGTERSGSVRDQRIEQLVPLVAPRELLEELPLTGEHADVLLRGRSEVQAILDGRDDRLLVVVGPCSVHDGNASRDYAERRGIPFVWFPAAAVATEDATPAARDEVRDIRSGAQVPADAATWMPPPEDLLPSIGVPPSAPVGG